MSAAVKGKSIAFKILKILGIFVIIIGVLYTILGIYISSRHTEIVRDLNKAVHEKFTGDIKIGDVEILFFKGFPNLNVEVKDVVVKDSLWYQHRKTIIDAKSIYVKVLPWSVLLGNIEVNTITLENAKIDIFVDKNGYSNASALTPRKKVKKDPKSKSMLDVEIDNIILHNVNIVSDNSVKNKSFAFDTEDLNIKLKFLSNGWNAKVNLVTKVNSLAFNTTKGSFAKDKIIEGELNADFNKEKGQVIVHSDKLTIGETDFKVDAELSVSPNNSKFGIHLNSESIYWKNAASLVSENISAKLNKFDFKEEFSVKCDILGDFKIKGEPSIHVIANIKDNVLTALNSEIHDCNFRGEFTNHYAKNVINGDPNSAILLHDFKGKYNEIPFITKDLSILNLKKPIASGYIESNFDVDKLNSIFGKKTFEFKKGKAKINVKFKSDVVDLKISKPFILGNVDIVNSDFSYIPGNVNFTNNSIQLQFNTDKLVVKNITLKTEKSAVVMSGYSENFMNLVYDNPEKIVLNWNINGEKIDLGGFLFFLKSIKKTSPKKIKNDTSNELLEKALHHSEVVLNLNVKQLVYKKFIGKNAIAKISLLNDKILIDEVSIKNGKGSYKINGIISNIGSKKAFNIRANVTNSDISELLNSFDNFGSTMMNSKTVKGTVNLKTNLIGFLNEGKGLDKKSLSGSLYFTLSNAALINFEPIQKIGKSVFPKRDFNHVTIENMTCDGTLKKGVLSIKPMEIKTSVMQIDVSGDYGFADGTDMKVGVHLKDPKVKTTTQKNTIFNLDNSKGIIVWLNVTNDNNGKMKIAPGSNKAKQKSSNNPLK
ncbi:DUF748 domain-containing protein [Flavobacterium sp. RSB2_4_14]|uniref:DUF748 domain-containing protein n=1 Tax=Flavobacterium sp. RSB2_4_14 TaxID=3447665 RepID=UPI003F3D9856